MPAAFARIDLFRDHLVALWEAILAVSGAGVGAASGLKDLTDLLRRLVNLEDVLVHLIQEPFEQQLPRLQHLCVGGDPTFDSKRFIELISAKPLSIKSPEDLVPVLLPFFAASVSTPGTTCPPEDLTPVYESILNSALRGLWKKIASYDQIANQVLLEQTSGLRSDAQATTAGVVALGSQLALLQEEQVKIAAGLKTLTTFAHQAWDRVYDRLLDAAPPSEHRIDSSAYPNPFLLVRAEDFNHNYEKLARLFQDSPEWDSIQRRTDNVFIEGGRGTGKSMLLRRLTAQATIAARRLSSPSATFDNIPEDYFGVYIKLTRGYYEQFGAIDTVSGTISALLAQHEINLEIADAFVDTLQWLERERALGLNDSDMTAVARDLGALFPNAQNVESLEALRKKAIRFEQDQIIAYYRNRAFGLDTPYQGSALDSVTFCRRLSEIFRTRLFPRRERRLFLLIDEFETLVEVQQIALNTVIKMRLPDVSLKVTVRQAGRKTADTFTAGDPIQQPRDYTQLPLDYDVTSTEYAQLLKRIAAKRLVDSGYTDADIDSYLPGKANPDEVSAAELQLELADMWEAGSRKHEAMTDEFQRTYSLAATYRVLGRAGRRKSFVGFDTYVLLSSGIVSNFMELCKYAFYFALSDEIPLREKPAIPSYLQTEAAYRVSQRLFSTIDGNVPGVGEVLIRLIADLARILRARLLRHPSEPEANRLSIQNYDELRLPEYDLLRDVIEGAVVWSVLHREDPGVAFQPKNDAVTSSIELIINRIYCPALRISPRARWRIPLAPRDLAALIAPPTRRHTFTRLSRTLGLADASEVQLLLSF